MNNSTGITYQNTGLTSRGTLRGYHASPSPNFINKTPYNVDLRGLKPTEKRRLLTFEGGEFHSKYAVGFEIEKTYFNRFNENQRGSRIGELALFKGFELDSSCGVEAITHILPLLPRGLWRNKVYNMFHQAKHILEDEFSPSNSDCGGHITLSCKGLTSTELFSKVAKYSGLIMSLYRMRLTNSYCNHNMTFNTTNYDWINGGLNRRGERNTRISSYKYAFCKLGTNGTIEFRVPPRVTGVKQLMKRYELFYELIDCAVNGVSWSKFMSRVKPIILAMYPDNENKARLILSQAKYFQKFIDTNGERTHEVTDVYMECNTEERQEKRREWFRL
tara:strand:+ start:829 stop:1824 length:996 start_codon:yes stop_codon:yes gene_type:complete